MKIIYKYPLPRISKIGTVKLPSDSKILDVNFQDEQLFVWVLCSPDSEMIDVRFVTYGTGWQIDDLLLEGSLEHIKTNHHQGFVWHTFKIIGTLDEYIRNSF